MTDSPNAMFRELFVELPHAVFEALQGIGEQAVHEAQKPKPRAKPSLVTHTGLTWFVGLLRERYGWSDSEVKVVADRDAWRFVVRLACGHRHGIEMDCESMLAHSADRDRAAMLIDRFDRHAHERSCYCVLRQETA